jgi:hypothetical protein
VARLHEAQLKSNPPFRLVLHFGAAAVKRMQAENEVRFVGECGVEGFSSKHKFYTPSA